VLWIGANGSIDPRCIERDVRINVDTLLEPDARRNATKRAGIHSRVVNSQVGVGASFAIGAAPCQVTSIGEIDLATVRHAAGARRT